jgi:hypothetical protein
VLGQPSSLNSTNCAVKQTLHESDRRVDAAGAASSGRHDGGRLSRSCNLHSRSCGRRWEWAAWPQVGFLLLRANARPARRPAESSALHYFARSGPTKEAHRRALNRPDGLLLAKWGGRAYGAMTNQRNDHPLPPYSQHSKKCPLTCGFGARGGIRTLDLPITSRTETLQLDPPSTILAAQVQDPLHPVRSRSAWSWRLGCQRGCQPSGGGGSVLAVLALGEAFRASDRNRKVMASGYSPRAVALAARRTARTP